MNRCLKDVRMLIVLMVCLMAWCSVISAQDRPVEEPSAAAKELPLDIGQQAVLSRFDRFEKELVQMAEQLRKADPERAELLFRTHSKSQQERVIGQMRVIQELLAGATPQFGDSIQRQEELVASLVTLLDLLQSENRISEIEAERARVKEILKNVNKLIGKEKDVRASTERGADPAKSAEDQEDVSNEAGNLIDDVRQQDAQKQADQKADESADSDRTGKPDDSDTDSKEPSAPKDGDSEPKPAGDSDAGNSQPKDGMPEDGESSEGKPKDGESPQSPPQDSQKPGNSQPQEGQPQQAQPQEGQPQEGQPENGRAEQQSQKKAPGREDLEEARKEMEKAIQELKEKEIMINSNIKICRIDTQCNSSEQNELIMHENLNIYYHEILAIH